MIYLTIFLLYYIIKQYKKIKKKNKIIDNLEVYKQIFKDKYVDDELDD